MSTWGRGEVSPTCTGTLMAPTVFTLPKTTPLSPPTLPSLGSPWMATISTGATFPKTPLGLTLSLTTAVGTHTQGTPITTTPKCFSSRCHPLCRFPAPLAQTTWLLPWDPTSAGKLTLRSSPTSLLICPLTPGSFLKSPAVGVLPITRPLTLPCPQLCLARRVLAAQDLRPLVAFPVALPLFRPPPLHPQQHPRPPLLLLPQRQRS